MAYYYSFNTDISEEALVNFIDFYNSIDEDSEVILYLYSEGGSLPVMSIMRDIIEKHGKTTIVANFLIASAAFNLFFTTSAKKEIIKGTRGMVHLPAYTTEILAHGRPTNDFQKINKIAMQELVSESAQIFDFVGLSDKHRKEVMKGEDVFLEAAELERFLKNIKGKKFNDIRK